MRPLDPYSVVTAPGTHASPPGGRGTVDVCDRFYGALMGFLAGCQQMGLASQPLLASPVKQTVFPKEIEELWQRLPTILLSYGNPNHQLLRHDRADEAIHDRFEQDPCFLDEASQVLYLLMEAPSPQSCHQALSSLSLSPTLAPLRQLLEASSFQWAICFDSLINRSLGIKALSTTQAEAQAFAGAVLGLWIGSAHGIRGIPLSNQFAFGPGKATIQQRAFQIFWQWAGSSQFDKVGVS